MIYYIRALDLYFVIDYDVGVEMTDNVLLRSTG